MYDTIKITEHNGMTSEITADQIRLVIDFLESDQWAQYADAGLADDGDKLHEYLCGIYSRIYSGV